MQIDALLIQLDKGHCPSPSQVALDLLDLLQNPSAGVNEAAAVVRLDPVLTAKTVKLANSVLYRGLRPTVAVDDAIMRIGMQALARLALGLSLIDVSAAVAEHFDLARYWNSALARAIAMQALAQRVGGWSTAELFTLGLLCDIGRLTLACAAPEECAEVALACTTPEELRHSEQLHFGFDHRQLSAALLRRWSFPELMTAAIDPKQASDGLRGNARFTSLLAILDLARSAGEWIEGLRSEDHVGMLQQRCEAWGFDPQLLDDVLDEIGNEWQEMSRLFELELPSEAQAKIERLRHGLTTAYPRNRDAPAPRVLVVDDDPASRNLLRRILEPNDYEVLEAADADSAMAVMYQSTPRIAVVDWVIPGMNGIELCRRLRAEFGARLYLLILTAHYDGAHTLEALEAGANDFLTKPFPRKVLLAKLQMAASMVGFVAELEEEHQSSQQTQRELSRLNEELRRVVVKDELTGLANRRALDNHLRSAWAQAQHHDHPLACIMLDIDHFKQINDDFGHDAGDRALRGVAELLQTHSRTGDLAVRYGGEEFVLICPHSDLCGSLKLAERIRAQVQELRGDFPAITLSAGVAQMTSAMSAPEQLLRAADQALLAAKRQGRNRVMASNDDDCAETAS